MKKELTPEQIAIIRYLSKEISQAVEITKETDYTNDGYRLDIYDYGPIYITSEEMEALKQLQTLWHPTPGGAALLAAAIELTAGSN